MDSKNPECVLSHHSREDHTIDDRHDYDYCLKCARNNSKEI